MGMRKGFAVVALAGILALSTSTVTAYEFWDSHDRGDVNGYNPFPDSHDRGDMSAYNPFPDSHDRGDMNA